MITETLILIFAGFVCVTTLYFLWRIAGYVTASQHLVSSLREKLDELGALKRRIDMLDADLSDKFDHFVKRSSARDTMRKKREAEAEDSNTGEILVAV